MSRKKGFTLVELLVVISIIALLMAILMPSLQKARKMAQGVVCQSNERQWAVYFQMYTSDYDGRFPNLNQPGGQWIGALRPYYGEATDVFFCPTATKTFQEGETNAAFRAWGPISERAQWYYDTYQKEGSYGINGWLYDLESQEGAFNHAPVEFFWRTINVDADPHQIPLLMDASFWTGRPHHNDSPPPASGVRSGNSDMSHYCVDRHGGAVNSAFFDGSVRKVGLKQLWDIKWHRRFMVNLPGPNFEVEAPWMVNLRDYD